MKNALAGQRTLVLPIGAGNGATLIATQWGFTGSNPLTQLNDSTITDGGQFYGKASASAFSLAQRALSQVVATGSVNALLQYDQAYYVSRIMLQTDQAVGVFLPGTSAVQTYQYWNYVEGVLLRSGRFSLLYHQGPMFIFSTGDRYRIRSIQGGAFSSRPCGVNVSCVTALMPGSKMGILDPVSFDPQWKLMPDGGLLAFDRPLNADHIENAGWLNEWEITKRNVLSSWPLGSYKVTASGALQLNFRVANVSDALYRFIEIPSIFVLGIAYVATGWLLVWRRSPGKCSLSATSDVINND
ncbi:MAG: hypothetical protein HKL80_10310 [Acidimicrobiales bacterium]|nr:hypothetical protein [Acidimicrobiales bacterium]